MPVPVVLDVETDEKLTRLKRETCVGVRAKETAASVAHRVPSQPIFRTETQYRLRKMGKPAGPASGSVGRQLMKKADHHECHP